ncbi:MAG: aminotransferase class III-fold pyridoxal phosphate-dependent enzyme [Candidatus Bathyarchaeia archaeon]
MRIARAYTSKEKVVKFDGHYHSWHDWHRFGYLQAGHLYSGGIPRSIEDDYFILPWNDPEKLKILRKFGNSIAAVICEPVVGNCGCIMPKDGYLEELRETCNEQDIVLIFDEVVTGFRLGLGGAQSRLGVIPDLAVFGKAVANGFPIALVAGREEIMMTKNVAIGGTFNSNPISCAAALATIEELEDRRNYEKMNNLGRLLMEGVNDAIQDVGVEAIVQGYPELFSIIFTDQDKIRSPNDLYSIKFHPHLRREVVFCQEMLNGGIFNAARRGNRWVLSIAHERKDIDKTIEVAEKSLKMAKKIS